MTGSYRLHAVPVATLPTPGWEVLFGINDQEMHELVFYVWLVSDGTVLGLIDTGLPLGATELARLNEANTRVDQRHVFAGVRPLTAVLDEYGIAPRDIDFVAVTQTISYHTGGLEARLLPRAEVYLSRAGLHEMLDAPPGHPPVEHYFTEGGWASLRQFAIEGRLHCADERTTIVRGIEFETTGGHHPGSAGLRVATEQGMAGLLETAFLDLNVQDVIPVGIAENAGLCRDVIRRYRAECDYVIAVHDPSNAARFPASALHERPRRR